MYEVITRFAESEATNGLMLIDMPTGSGKNSMKRSRKTSISGRCTEVLSILLRKRKDL